MADNLNLLFELVGSLIFASLIVTFIIVYRRDSAANSHQRRIAKNDLANMMILLQTMRDLLDQQKNLARQFNTVLEKKAWGFKQQLDAAHAEIDFIRESVRRIQLGLNSASTDGAPSGAQNPNSTSDTINASTTRPLESLKRPQIHEIERPTLRVLASPTNPSSQDSDSEPWVGLDFGPDTPDPLAHDVPDVPPQRPMDADAAREAFRTLLNMEGKSTASLPPSNKMPTTPVSGKGNGHGQINSVQSSVYEYHDAGMTPAEIAHELGIGRGEVRLILSLRKDRNI